MLKAGVVNKIKGVKKQDLTKEFQSPVFMAARNKIIDLAKKSGLRTLNALTVAKEMRKVLKQKQ